MGATIQYRHPAVSAESPHSFLIQTFTSCVYRTILLHALKAVVLYEAPMPLSGSWAASVSLSAPPDSLPLSTRGLERASKLPGVLLDDALMFLGVITYAEASSKQCAECHPVPGTSPSSPRPRCT
jgi:hypothetical protein